MFSGIVIPGAGCHMVSLRTQAVTAPPPVALIESEEGVDEEDPEEDFP